MENKIINIKSRKDFYKELVSSVIKTKLIFKNYSEGIIIYGSKKIFPDLKLSVEVIDPFFIFYKKQCLKDFIEMDTLEYLKVSIYNDLQTTVKQFIFKNELDLNKLYPKDDRLTEKEVLKLLSIGRSTLWRGNRSGKFKKFTIGNRVFYSKKQILEAVKPK